MNAFCQNCAIHKAGTTTDPDTPSHKDAMHGPHCDEFLQAMAMEIETLEHMEAWTVM